MSGCEVLALGAHPDDVELGCGATLARLSAAGRSVAILDLTAGESGTRGDVTTRRSEASAAAAELGAAWRTCLELPDGRLDSGDQRALAAVVGALRSASPRALLLPSAADAHPDHRAAAELGARAAFLAGVARLHPELGTGHRPRLVLAYPGPRQPGLAGVLIDVSGFWARKRSALERHVSQFEVAAGAPTHLATGHFLAAIEGRDRAAGNLIGCECAEGFDAVWPLAADELAWLLSAEGERR